MRSFNLPYWRTQVPWLGVLLAALTVTLIAAIFFVSIDRAQLQRAQSAEVTRTASTLEKAFLLLSSAQAGVRGFLISGQLDFLQPYETLAEHIEPILQGLHDSARSSRQPELIQALATLQALTDNFLQHLHHTVRLRRDAADPQAAASYVISGESTRALEQVRQHITLIQEGQERWLSTRDVGATLSAHSMKVLIALSTGFTCLLLAGASWLLKREIRHRQRAEQALHKANQALTRRAEQLKTSNLELESFSYSISHDLRIPLRAVGGYARMLEEDYGAQLDAEGLRRLQVIRDNGQRMGQLIDDLLAFSRLGRKPLQAGEIDMNALVEALVAQIQGGQDSSRSQFEIDTLVPASGDRALLQQVWLNLISNAVKYSATRAQPKIRIYSLAGADENVYAVSDNGVGFDMQYYDKLFGVFQRLHGADEFPGSGVGLAIVQRIVARHGGRVWAEAQPDQGATFFFALPHDGATHG